MSIDTNSAAIVELSNHEHCLICDEVTDLEEHHWQYEHDGRGEITIDICRDCHEQIHEDARPKDYYGYRWLEQAVSNLLQLHEEHNGRAHPKDVLDRYNVQNYYFSS